MADVERHPYNTSEGIPEGTRLLIVGTAPPLRFANDENERFEGDVDFFYGSIDNQLWSKILPKVYNTPISQTKSAMVAFLKAHKIWMVDVLETYRREQPNASDQGLQPVTFTNFSTVFRQHQQVDTVIFTGGLAEALTIDRLEEEELMRNRALSGNQKTMPKYAELEINIDDNNFKKIDFYTLPSPSKATRLYSLDRKIELYTSVLLHS